MRISAIRLRNIRRFDREGLAIENIPSGLSVLAEPNEFGKSTLFEVLRVALFEKHSNRNKNVKQLESVSGSSPLIELDFIANEKKYRIRKQFLKGSFAELLHVDTGEKLKADGEAHDWIIDLIGATKAGEGPTGLLWVEQGNSMDPPEAGESGKTLLASLLEQEVGEVTGGERARLILKRAQEELSKLVTKTGQPRNGPYKTVLSDLEQTDASISDIESKLSSAENLLVELQQLTQTIKGLEDPEELNRIETELKNARERLQKAEKEHDLLSITYDRLEDKKIEVSRSKKDLEDFLKQSREAEALLQTLESVPEKRNACKSKIEKCENDRRRNRSQEQQLKLERTKAEKTLDLCVKAERLVTARERSESLRESLQKAEKTHQEIVSLKGRLNRNQISDSILDKMKNANNKLVRLKEQLSSDSTTITPFLTSLGENIVTLDGQKITKRTEITGSQVLHLGDYGEIAIDANIPEEIKNDYENTKIGFEDMLSSHGVLTLSEAEEKAVEHRNLKSNIQNLQFQLDHLAPKGITKLKETYETECAVLSDESISEDIIANLPTITVAQQQCEYSRQAYDHARNDLNDSEIAYREALSESNQLESETEQHDQQYKKIIANIGARDTWNSEKEKFTLNFEKRTKEREELENEIEEKENSFPTLEVARDDVKRFEESKEINTKKLHSKKIREAEVRRDLAAISDKGLEEELGNLKQQKNQLENRRLSLESHISALRLLESILVESQKSLQEQFLKPVSNELGPLLKIVFPDAEVALGGDYYAEELRRHDRIDTIDTLSGGTREQIAVLTRLAFAQLMAKRGREMPVILDDALVWCDDKRLEDVFRALRYASRDVQCIVLTCHEKGFSTLGAPILDVQKWPVD